MPTPSQSHGDENFLPKPISISGYDTTWIVVRRLIPRKPELDSALEQTCVWLCGHHQAVDTQTADWDDDERTLVIYIPHVTSATEIPWYHPAVRGIAWLHVMRRPRGSTVDGDGAAIGTLSIHYQLFAAQPLRNRDRRMAQHLLATAVKHGHGIEAGYVKRVQHDVVVAQAPLQNTYTRLKTAHAKRLLERWVEQTDPAKHIFEDLGIAAFLIELWAKVYGVGKKTWDRDKGVGFPGFVDIGCGNGVLVDILTREGYDGWGFDARRRKTWNTFDKDVRQRLEERVLIPSILHDDDDNNNINNVELGEMGEVPNISNGLFYRRDISTSNSKGSQPPLFIISNHADELTPWTPLLATLTDSPFLIIPCCSHNLTGARFRATVVPTPGSNKQPSTYASLVLWVTRLAEECGWKVEKEMLRIPSTRNTALIGLQRKSGIAVDHESAKRLVREIISKEGGADGWVRNAMVLTKSVARGH
jgi:tRNASer (uridine44-2'-O)-methyltransferase